VPTLSDGQFTFTIPVQDLARGLRPSRRNPRNSKFLTKCVGAVGMDGVLEVLEDLTDDLIDTSGLGSPVFPYPQLFVFTNLIIVAIEEAIYEFDGTTLTLVLDLTGYGGISWSAIDGYEYVYMSNGVIAISRSATSGVWAIDSTLPIARALCNYNGQIVASINSANIVEHIKIWWKFDETTGQRLDSSGNDYHLDKRSGQESRPYPTSEVAQIDNGIVFEKISYDSATYPAWLASVSIPSSVIYNSYKMSCWFRGTIPASIPNDCSFAVVLDLMAEFGESGFTNNLSLLMLGSDYGDPGIRIVRNGTTLYTFINDADFHFLEVISLNGITESFYIDGVLVATSTIYEYVKPRFFDGPAYIYEDSPDESPIGVYITLDDFKFVYYELC
jgi:hypothetical protein